MTQTKDPWRLAVEACLKIKNDHRPTDLGSLLGITSQAVTQWNVIPVDHVATIAEKTGMTKLQIRPDREDLFGD